MGANKQIACTNFYFFPIPQSPSIKALFWNRTRLLIVVPRVVAVVGRGGFGGVNHSFSMMPQSADGDLQLDRCCRRHKKQYRTINVPITVCGWGGAGSRARGRVRYGTKRSYHTYCRLTVRDGHFSSSASASSSSRGARLAPGCSRPFALSVSAFVRLARNHKQAQSFRGAEATSGLILDSSAHRTLLF